MMRCFLICLFGGALVAQEGLQSSQRLVVEGVFRSQAVVDIEGDGRPELLLGREDGILFVYRQADSQGFEETPWATLELGDPSSLIVTTVQKLGGPIGAAILALGPEGARAWPLTSDGKLGEMVLLSRRARFELRTRGPVFLDFARDIDSDGNLDLLVPALETIEVWLQRPPRDPGDSPEFRKSARISVKSSVDSGTANRIGDDALYQRIRIPDLQTKDVNGDGK
ncbi:MAG: hypothetical protein KDB53_19315, partial [Planctomycetes bacterium]|nr:hypothetical protein [Planctomycetota bacterium]